MLAAVVDHTTPPNPDKIAATGTKTGRRVNRQTDGLLCDDLALALSHLYLFPQVFRRVRSFDGLDVQVAHTIVLPDGRVPRVRERTRALIAEPGHIVLVPAVRTTRENQRQGFYIQGCMLGGGGLVAVLTSRPYDGDAKPGHERI